MIYIRYIFLFIFLFSLSNCSSQYKYRVKEVLKDGAVVCRVINKRDDGLRYNYMEYEKGCFEEPYNDLMFIENSPNVKFKVGEIVKIPEDSKIIENEDKKFHFVKTTGINIPVYEARIRQSSEIFDF